MKKKNLFVVLMIALCMSLFAFAACVDKDIVVASVTLNKTATTIEKGASETLVATIAPTDATIKDLVWSTANAEIATVNASGVVTAIKKGEAVITATSTKADKNATCKVTVTETIAVKGVTLDKATASVFVGENVQLTAAVNPANTTLSKEVVYATSDAAVASVDAATGLVSGLSSGLATITATLKANEAFSASCIVTVTANSVAFSQAACTGNFDNTDNINEMLTSLWRSGNAKETVQGIDVWPVFSIAENGNLVVNSSNVSDGLKTWVKTQWGGSSIPVKLSYAFGAPADKATEALFDNSYLAWVDLSATKNVTTVDKINDSFNVSYTVEYKNAEVTFGKAVCTSNSENKANINEMMTSLWRSGNTMENVQGIDIMPIFSATENGSLVINVFNINDGLKLWVKTQWGGTSIPVQIKINNVDSSLIVKEKDANWNSQLTVWIDLENVFAQQDSIQLVTGSTVAIPVVAYENAVFSAESASKDKVNQMMKALWLDANDGEMVTAFGFNVDPIFSVNEKGNLVVNQENVTESLLTWINTQWGGTSVPVCVVMSESDNVKLEANWSNQYIMWIDLAPVVAD